MKKSYQFSVLLSVLFASNVVAQITKSISGLHHVESVVSEGKFLYAADIGNALSPTTKDGDGQIIKYDKKGKLIDAAFSKERLNAPKGLSVNDGVLFLNDIDRVVALDLSSGNKLYEIDFSKETSFLNDSAVWDDATLFVSATDTSKLFKVNLTNQSYTEIKTDITIAGVNGLFCYKKASRLYVNGFGSNNQPNGVVGYINLKDNTFKRLTNLEGYFDGLYISKDVLYVGNWVAFEKKGVVMGINLINNRCTKIKTIEPISGPADFIIKNDELIMPAMLSGEIHFIQLDSDLSLKL
ncbi:hypothetical protein G4D82_08245 [Flavobacterium sp. CYK-4]|uniref:hypothetical protein n=1 Tax=Flavobacterium lotistagni TaxID=2709660 RepID=UPI0014098390|nr:hypothetical protein [Flavobacterium lotistagni]NHM07210.1 hypothetical protein [Flavobacterium lotistagni]